MASNNLIIDSILQSEKTADQIILNAKENALKILSDAEIKAEQIKQKSLEDYKQKIANDLKISEEEALKNYNLRLDEYRQQAEKMISSANENVEKVVEYLVKRVK